MSDFDNSADFCLPSTRKENSWEKFRSALNSRTPVTHEEYNLILLARTSNNN